MELLDVLQNIREYMLDYNFPLVTPPQVPNTILATLILALEFLSISRSDFLLWYVRQNSSSFRYCLNHFLIQVAATAAH